MWTLSADVGGTFTDLVLLDSDTRSLYFEKVLSTAGCTTSVTDGIRRILARAGARNADLGLFVHGFTIATNAWLTRQGANTVLVVTEGFADVLEIGSQRRPKLYSLTSSRPRPLVARSSVVEARERTGALGAIIEPLTSEEADAIVERVAALEPEAVAVSLLFGHINPAHEDLLVDRLSARLPDVPTYAGSRIDPQAGEYPRTNTTVTAAYVGPVVDRYLDQLQRALPEHGVAASLLLMRSDGGVATPDAARDNPGHMLLSGPAGGVVAGAELGRVLEIPDLVTFDMGGTSADFSLVHGGEVARTHARLVRGEPLRLPSLGIETISSGGGSIGSVDLGGALRVGPESAGADPGPACYGRGGLRPTVTDAALVLGILSATEYLDGEIPLDIEAARTALRTEIAEPLAIGIEDAAFGMIAISTAQMAQAIRGLSVERGHDVRDFALLSFGGAGSMFAAFLARDLEMPEILVPSRPGVFAALGLLLSDIRHTAQVEFHRPLLDVAPEEVRTVVDLLIAGLDHDLARDGVPVERRSFRLAADLRLVGQFHELTVPLPDNLDAAWDGNALAQAFHRTHGRVYGQSDASLPCEIVNLRAEGTGVLDKPDLSSFRPERAAAPSVSPESSRPVYLGPEAGFVSFTLHRRDALEPGSRVAGPAIVTQRDTTILVLPGQVGETTPEGVMRIAVRKGEQR